MDTNNKETSNNKKILIIIATFLGVIIILLAVSLWVLVEYRSLDSVPQSTSTSINIGSQINSPTVSSTSTITLIAPTIAPSETPVIITQTATSTQTPIISDQPPACIHIGQTWTSRVDGMTLLCVPGGEFTLGSDNGYDSERPAQMVFLDTFWIDQTEVTNEQYLRCVNEESCTEPGYSEQSYNYRNFKYTNYPVIYVDWNQAWDYCNWAKERLPTEAEWEKAARGVDGRTYPWGNQLPNENLLNFKNNIGHTTEVGRYSNGISPYGALDMAGNVWEWTSTLYKPYPYNPVDGRENLNVNGNRILKGGSYYDVANSVRTTIRSGAPNGSGSNVGFRCVRSATSPNM